MDAYQILMYELKVAILLAAFYILYRFLLRKETFHGVNRAVLLSISALSFILPLCVITIEKVVELPVDSNIATVDSQIAVLSESPSIWPRVLLGIVLSGTIFFLFKCLRAIFRVKSIIRDCRILVMKDGTRLLVTPQNVSPFSWMSYIVISENELDDISEEIILHEKAHVRLRHSYDIIFYDILIALQWFNPAVWLMRNDLGAIHEYQADSLVLRNGVEPRKYQLLLIKESVGMISFSIANNFNHNTLKKRITMMLSKRSNSTALLKVLFIIPIIGISLIATSRTRTTFADSEKFTDNKDTTIYYLNDKLIDKTVLDTLKVTSIKVIKDVSTENCMERYLYTEKESAPDHLAVNIIQIDKSSLSIEDLYSQDLPYYIDNKQISKKDLKSIPADQVMSITVIKEGKETSEKGIKPGVYFNMKKTE